MPRILVELNFVKLKRVTRIRFFTKSKQSGRQCRFLLILSAPKITFIRAWITIRPPHRDLSCHVDRETVYVENLTSEPATRDIIASSPLEIKTPAGSGLPVAGLDVEKTMYTNWSFSNLALNANELACRRGRQAVPKLDTNGTACCPGAVSRINRASPSIWLSTLPLPPRKISKWHDILIKHIHICNYSIRFSFW